jgi:hypothetical protein
MPNSRLKFASHYTLQSLFGFTLCFFLATSSACAQGGGKNYYPLVNGARWEYVGRFSSSNGGEYNIHMTSKVDGETLINGKRYFKLITTADFSNVPTIGRQIEDTRYYRFAEDGIYFRPGNDPDKPDLLEIPLPIPTGVKWLSGATEVQAERAGTIQIGGRSYKDCLKLTFRLADGVRTTTNYYAPGVGIIKNVYVNTTEPKSVVELTLDRYER